MLRKIFGGPAGIPGRSGFNNICRRMLSLLAVAAMVLSLGLGFDPGGYALDDDQVIISGVKKANVPFAADQFTFDLFEAIDDTFTTLVAPAAISTTTNLADGTFAFPELTYSTPGTHYYVVKERNTGASGWAYDTTEHYVTVEAKLGGGGAVFANKTVITGVATSDTAVVPPPPAVSNADALKDTANVKVGNNWSSGSFLLKDGAKNYRGYCFDLWLPGPAVDSDMTLKSDTIGTSNPQSALAAALGIEANCGLNLTEFNALLGTSVQSDAARRAIMAMVVWHFEGPEGTYNTEAKLEAALKEELKSYGHYNTDNWGYYEKICAAIEELTTIGNDPALSADYVKVDDTQGYITINRTGYGAADATYIFTCDPLESGSRLWINGTEITAINRSVSLSYTTPVPVVYTGSNPVTVSVKEAGKHLYKGSIACYLFAHTDADQDLGIGFADFYEIGLELELPPGGTAITFNNTYTDPGIPTTPPEKIYDAALRKWVAEVDSEGDIKTYSESNIAAVPVKVGDKVTFGIRLTNQGTEAVILTDVSDYMPAGLAFNKADFHNDDWTQGGTKSGSASWLGGAQTTLTVLSYGKDVALNPGQSTVIYVTLRVENTDDSQGLINVAEISGMTDKDDKPVTDKDSTPDDNPFNDGPLKDNEMGEDGKDGRDEDDHDIAKLIPEEPKTEPKEPEPNPSSATIILSKRLRDGAGNNVGNGKTFTIYLYDADRQVVDSVVVAANGGTQSITGLKPATTYYLAEVSGEGYTISGYEIVGGASTNHTAIGIQIPAIADGDVLEIRIIADNTTDNPGDIPDETPGGPEELPDDIQVLPAREEAEDDEEVEAEQEVIPEAGGTPIGLVCMGLGLVIAIIGLELKRRIKKASR